MTETNKLPSHIYKTKNGYRVRFRSSEKFPVPFDKSCSTLEEAKSEKSKYLAKLELKIYTGNTKKDMGFSDFCDYVYDWYKNKPKRISQNTLRTYKQYMSILKRLFKNKKIRDITTLDIEIILTSESQRQKVTNGVKAGEKISGNTLHHEYTMLRIILNKAKKWGFIEYNPIDAVEEPTFERKKIEVPEYDELDDIEKKIMSASVRDRCIYLLAFFTGMRAEEVCGVHVDFFDREKLTVRVDPVVVYDVDTRKYKEDKPKSPSSKRTIPLPQRFFNVLDEYLKYRENQIAILKSETKNNYTPLKNLFLNKNGDYYRPNRVSQQWGKFRKKNNLNITFHGLRHYYLTNQMNYNTQLSPRDVQEIAGHADIKTTYRYVHASQDRINNNATNIYDRFDKDQLYKNGDNNLTIPIEHVTTIILGNPDYSRIDDLKITLSEMSNKDVNFFNISEIMLHCKNYLEANYPSLSRLEKYNYSDKNRTEIIKNIQKEFGKEFIIYKNKDKSLEL